MIFLVWLRIISSMVGKIHPCPIVELIHIIEWLTFKIVSKLYIYNEYIDIHGGFQSIGVPPNHPVVMDHDLP
jgi:hypothetical protein